MGAAGIVCAVAKVVARAKTEAIAATANMMCVRGLKVMKSSKECKVAAADPGDVGESEK